MDTDSFVPGDDAEACRVVPFAAAAGHTLVPVGSGRRAESGSLPTGRPIPLGSERLVVLVERDPRKEMLAQSYRSLAAQRISPDILPQPQFTHRNGKVEMERRDCDWAPRYPTVAHGPRPHTCPLSDFCGGSVAATAPGHMNSGE